MMVNNLPIEHLFLEFINTIEDGLCHIDLIKDPADREQWSSRVQENAEDRLQKEITPSCRYHQRKHNDCFRNFRPHKPLICM